MPLIKIVVLVWCLACSMRADAEAPKPKPGSAEAQRQAKARFKQGEAFQRQKLYDEAIKEYEAAYALAPLPELLFNVAEAHNLKGDKDKALEMYNRFLALRSEGPVADQARIYVAILTKDKQARDEAARQKEIEEDNRRRAEEAGRAAAVAAEIARVKNEEERKIREIEDQKLREAEAKRKAEQDRIARIRAEELAREQAKLDAWSKRRADRRKRRKTGYRIGGVGVGFGAVSALFGYLGGRTNTTIEEGGFGSASEIADEVSKGKIFNKIAIGTGIVGGLGLAIGAGIVIGSLDIGEFKVSTTATGEVKGIVLGGSLP